MGFRSSREAHSVFWGAACCRGGAIAGACLANGSQASSREPAEPSAGHRGSIVYDGMASGPWSREQTYWLPFSGDARSALMGVAAVWAECGCGLARRRRAARCSNRWRTLSLISSPHYWRRASTSSHDLQLMSLTFDFSGARRWECFSCK